ncbi:MAG: class I SAM-dependent methyltransferase [Mariprofundus sp.]
MNTNIVKCDLCGDSEIEIVSRQDRHGKQLQTGLCSGCGLVMHVPVPDETEVADYYARLYRQDYHGERQPSDRRVMRAWNNAERIYRQLQARLPAGGSVFEVGAGIGCTVKYFEMQGFDATGIEPNKDFNAFTRDRLRARVENQNLYDLQAEQDVDLLLLIHVIEHFTSPKKALQHMHGLIHDKGLLYIECPNLTGPFATFSRMFHYAHIYNFTPLTLQALAAQCGFELLEYYSQDDEADIRMLFRKADAPARLPDLSTHANQVRESLKHYNTVSYHARPAYLSRRARKVTSYLMEYMQAKEFVTNLLSRVMNEAADKNSAAR